jgi:hypothetical protein
MDFEYPEEYEFFNVKTGEKRTLNARGGYAKHMINGFILSSNLSQNSSRGQDFGWRLARDTLVTVKKAQQNQYIMREIATAKGVNPRGVRLPDLIEFLVDSYNNTLQSQEIAEDEAPRFQAEYEASLRGTGVDATATISSDIITDDKIEESTATKTPAKKA